MSRNRSLLSLASRGFAGVAAVVLGVGLLAGCERTIGTADSGVNTSAPGDVFGFPDDVGPPGSEGDGED